MPVLSLISPSSPKQLGMVSPELRTKVILYLGPALSYLSENRRMVAPGVHDRDERAEIREPQTSISLDWDFCREASVMLPFSEDDSKNFSIDLVDVVRLREIGLASGLAKNARRWIESMTPERDNEDGFDFWRWIAGHHLEDSGNPLFDTLFLVEKMTGVIVTTGSLVPDDREVGKRFGIDGIWLGGVNVRCEYRGRKLVNVPLDVLHRDIQERVNHAGMPIPVNLFTSSEIAALYTRHGYVVARTLAVPLIGAKVWCRRIFHPAAGPSEGCREESRGRELPGGHDQTD